MPLPGSLVVKKGFDGVGDDLRRHARSGVRDADYSVAAGGQVQGGSISGFEVLPGDIDGECAALRHGISGIDGEIQQGVFKLARIYKNHDNFCRRVELQFEGSS